MNRIAYTRAITLIGKLAAKTKLLESVALTMEDKELVRQCLEEYTFYHAHETSEVAAGAVGKPSGKTARV